MTITVAANNARIRYTATSSQTAFAIPFEFFENDEIHVYVGDTALVAATERGQGTGSTEYGISGGGGSTGAIAFVTGITQGHIVTIVRDIPIERITDFTAGTTINRAALNTQLDTLTAMVGDLKDKSDRAIRLQPYDSEITLFLPTINNRAGKIFGFDANGNLTADTSANFDITLDDVVSNTLTMAGNPNSKFNLTAVVDSQLVTSGAVMNIKSTKGGNTATISLDGSATVALDFNAGNKTIRMQDHTSFSSTVEVVGALTAPLIVSQSGGSITLQPTGNQVFIKGTSGESRITFHNPAAPSMEFTGDSSLIGSGSFLLDITDEIILDSASGSLLIKDAGVLRMTLAFNGASQSITSANDLTIASSASGIAIKPATSSTDFLATNGAQTIGVISSAGTAHLKWYQNSNTTLLKVVNPTGTRTLLLPDESGTIHSSGGATTHANITVSTDGKVQFRDSAIYIQSGADGHLDLVADTEIHIAATTVNVDGLMDVSGNLTVGGTTDVATLEFNSLSGTGAVTITDILDEDNLASNSATKLATQQSIKAYVDAEAGTDTLAEVLAVGNRTSGAGKIEFRDAAIYLNSSADGQLDIVADTEIQIAATTIDINGAVDMSSTLGVTGVVTANAGVVVDTMTLDAATLTATGDFTVDSAGDIVLDAAGEDIKFFVGGSAKGRFTHSSGDFVIQADTQDKDMIFKGDMGGVSTAALTLDMSAAGQAIFNRGITTGGGTTLIKCATNDNIRIGQETHAAIGAINDAATAFVELKLDGSTLLLNSQSSGSVSVGTAGIIDSSLMQVRGTKNYSSGVTRNMLSVIDNQAYNATDNGGSIVFGGVYKSDGSFASFGQIQGIKRNNTTNDFGGNMVFNVRTNGGTMFNHTVLENDGDLRIQDGNLVIGTAGHGIDFSAQTATGGNSASISSEILDHYEEGTWTPTIVTGGNNIAPNIKSTYTKIGNQVYIQMYFGTGAATGNTATFVIGGLPFTVPANSFNIGSVDIGKSAHVGIYPRTKASSTNLEFFYSAGNVSTDRQVVLGNDIGANSYVVLSITYLIN